MQQGKDDQHIRRMADLLRQGATLTDMACPVCASPLFRLKDGTLWCGKDRKKVIIAKEGEESPQPATSGNMDTLQSTLLAKIEKIKNRIDQTEDLDELQKLTSALSELLNSLEKIKRMSKQ